MGKAVRGTEGKIKNVDKSHEKIGNSSGKIESAGNELVINLIDATGSQAAS